MSTAQFQFNFMLNKSDSVEPAWAMATTLMYCINNTGCYKLNSNIISCKCSIYIKNKKRTENKNMRLNVLRKNQQHLICKVMVQVHMLKL